MTKYYRALTRFPPPLGPARHGLVVEHRLEGLPGHTLAVDGWRPPKGGDARGGGTGAGARIGAAPAATGAPDGHRPMAATKPPEAYRKQWKLLKQLGVLPPSSIDPAEPGGMGPGWGADEGEEKEEEGEEERSGGEGKRARITGEEEKGVRFPPPPPLAPSGRFRSLSARAKDSLLIVRHVWPLRDPLCDPSTPPSHFESLIELKTGRTHQIRAQMAALGCPLVGDSLYAPLADPGFRRLLLEEGEGWRERAATLLREEEEREEQRKEGLDTESSGPNEAQRSPSPSIPGLDTTSSGPNEAQHSPSPSILSLDTESSGPNATPPSSSSPPHPLRLSPSTVRLLRATLAPGSVRRPLEPPEAVGLQATRVDVRGNFGGKPRHVSLRAGVPPWRRGGEEGAEEGGGVPRGLQRAGEGWGQGEAPWEGERVWLGERDEPAERPFPRA